MTAKGEDGKAAKGGCGAEAGWEMRSILDEPRLGEIVEAYRELGFEVRVSDLSPELALECGVCMEGDPGRYRVIYTRRGSRKEAATLAGDAFD